MNSPDREADRWFAEQVLPHEPALRAWLRARYPSLTDVDDLVQETYARILRARNASQITSVKAFLFTAARNLVVDQFRRQQVVAIESIAEIDSVSVSEDAPGVSETVSRKQEIELLMQAIQSLPERCRQVVTLRKIYGLSLKEIARELGISEHTVEAQIATGVRRCTAFLARRGIP